MAATAVPAAGAGAHSSARPQGFDHPWRAQHRDSGPGSWLPPVGTELLDLAACDCGFHLPLAGARTWSSRFCPARRHPERLTTGGSRPQAVLPHCEGKNPKGRGLAWSVQSQPLPPSWKAALSLADDSVEFCAWGMVQGCHPLGRDHSVHPITPAQDPCQVHCVCGELFLLGAGGTWRGAGRDPGRAVGSGTF